MEKISAEIKKIDKVLSENLIIPDYQRPYRWEEENVRLLLQDVYDSWKSGKSSYRIGSVILFQESDNELYIVDGQQRITTILLVMKSLNNTLGSELSKNLKYNHADSRYRIHNNKQFIDSWIKDKLNSEKEDFIKYLTQYCEFVEIRVTDLSEAFQMFDSQNGRGKELEAYNLLKAYHIRAMETDSLEIKIECDRRWEAATRYKKTNEEQEPTSDVLRQIFKEQLYRTRIWSKKNDAYSFDKKKLSEFKGFTLDSRQNISYPFQNNELLHYFANKYLQTLGVEIKGIKKRFNNKDFENIDSFVLINQNIINGKAFFDYIETYVEIYKQLFRNDDKDCLSEFKTFYSTYSKNYTGAHRDGDRYLRELYKSLIFITFDKYGEEGLNKFYKPLYASVYRLRLEKYQVKYNAVAQYPKELFSIIENSRSYFDLRSIERHSRKEIECKKEVKEIIDFFTQFGVSIKYAK